MITACDLELMVDGNMLRGKTNYCFKPWKDDGLWGPKLISKLVARKALDYCLSSSSHHFSIPQSPSCSSHIGVSKDIYSLD